jgi:hypothetical protein
MGKNAKYSGQENLAIARAYIMTSEDSLVGTGRKAGDFFEAVLKKFKTLIETKDSLDLLEFIHPLAVISTTDLENARKRTTVTKQWKAIAKEVKVFHGIFKKVVSWKKSGYAFKDVVRLAEKLYAKTLKPIDVDEPESAETEMEDDLGAGEDAFEYEDVPPFLYHHAWIYLKDKPTFTTTIDQKKPTLKDAIVLSNGVSNASTSEPATPSTTPNSRPMGNKVAHSVKKENDFQYEMIKMRKESNAANSIMVERELALSGYDAT